MCHIDSDIFLEMRKSDERQLVFFLLFLLCILRMCALRMNIEYINVKTATHYGLALFGSQHTARISFMFLDKCKQIVSLFRFKEEEKYWEMRMTRENERKKHENKQNFDRF